MDGVLCQLLSDEVHVAAWTKQVNFLVCKLQVGDVLRCQFGLNVLLDGELRVLQLQLRHPLTKWTVGLASVGVKKSNALVVSQTLLDDGNQRCDTNTSSKDDHVLVGLLVNQSTGRRSDKNGVTSLQLLVDVRRNDTIADLSDGDSVFVVVWNVRDRVLSGLLNVRVLSDKSETQVLTRQWHADLTTILRGEVNGLNVSALVHQLGDSELSESLPWLLLVQGMLGINQDLSQVSVSGHPSINKLLGGDFWAQEVLDGGNKGVTDNRVVLGLHLQTDVLHDDLFNEVVQWSQVVDVLGVVKQGKGQNLWLLECHLVGSIEEWLHFVVVVKHVVVELLGQVKSRQLQHRHRGLDVVLLSIGELFDSVDLRSSGHVGSSKGE